MCLYLELHVLVVFITINPQRLLILKFSRRTLVQKNEQSLQKLLVLGIQMLVSLHYGRLNTKQYVFLPLVNKKN